jgi:hypothetical protein
VSVEAALAHALRQLESFYAEMRGAFAPPVFVDEPPYPRFRYAVHTDSLACYLKGGKLVSTLNAALILYQHGYPQEVGALCRMADDFSNEVMFILLPQGGEEVDATQRQFLENFFQEEFDDARDPLGSEQTRVTVPAKKIHAAFAKLAANEINPSDAQEMLRTIQQAFSGYVHGAYPHIMELYGGDPPRFHLSGMPNTPTTKGWKGQLVGYVYRAIMLTALVSRKLKYGHLEPPIRALMADYEKETGCAPVDTAARMLDSIKRNAA